jgi:hypothetical protein
MKARTMNSFADALELTSTAADFSRQLSKKVFLGQCRVATLGRWRGGTAIYGLRRLLVGENGKPKTLLEYGERKNLKSEHVILVPGPKSEIRIVQHLFDSFANKKKTRTEIDNELNAKRIRNARGNPWSTLTISNMLKNEVYLGNLVFNRRSQKLGERLVKNPNDMWIRCDRAFKPIISQRLFAKAQDVLAELERGKVRSDKDLLEDLARLLRKNGRLDEDHAVSEGAAALECLCQTLWIGRERLQANRLQTQGQVQVCRDCRQHRRHSSRCCCCHHCRIGKATKAGNFSARTLFADDKPRPDSWNGSCEVRRQWCGGRIGAKVGGQKTQIQKSRFDAHHPNARIECNNQGLLFGTNSQSAQQPGLPNAYF